VRTWLRNNGLSLAMMALFVVCWTGQSLSGWHQLREEQREHHQPETTYRDYLGSGDFLEATFENWESEFLQMAAFLILSSMFIQRGAAESRKPDERAASSPAGRSGTGTPWRLGPQVV
jgi:hypothetical protein